MTAGFLKKNFAHLTESIDYFHYTYFSKHSVNVELCSDHGTTDGESVVLFLANGKGCRNCMCKIFGEQALETCYTALDENMSKSPLYYTLFDFLDRT